MKRMLALSVIVPAAWGAVASAPARGAEPDLTAWSVVSEPGTPRPPFRFEPEDEALLDAIQLGCLNFFLDEVDPVTGMVLDRTGARTISVAGVGFQLTVLCIADHRGWLEPGEAGAIALRIVRALHANPANRERGVFYHYLEPGTAGPSSEGYEEVASTVDTALLFAGLLTAGRHFGGDIRELADDLVLNADWRSYILDRPSTGHNDGFISLGWRRPRDPDAPFGEGLLSFTWSDTGDEQRLTAFIARLPTDPSRRVPPEMYHGLRRTLGTMPDGRPIVWFPWSGALFTAFFAHCWIDDARRGPDDPAAWGVEHRPRVDWWENSRRTAQLHRARAIENPRGLPGFGPDLWGLSACDGDGRYLVPGVFPTLAPVQFGEPGRDHLTKQPKDNWADGTVAPYAAGSTIMFEPGPALDALRNYRRIAEEHAPALWADPASGGHGFADSFRPGPDGTVVWVAPDRVAIDAGPLMIAIENARSGFVWDTFMAHPSVRANRLLADPLLDE
ncbi:MAG: hypothetical protein LAT64_08725 [Phycisphaerales bacterium]|nr:hypothetical protein [Planctomycetota bacterium]MCH8508833.1 hypothetical protein [Phycisphaerales bacterium]